MYTIRKTRFDKIRFPFRSTPVSYTHLFGSAHRAHCSTVGVTEFLSPNVSGYLLGKELDFLGKAVDSPERPLVAILGGAKVSDKLNVISNLLEKCDTLIIGGGMAYTFLKAKGCEVGTSLVDEDKICLLYTSRCV